MVHSRHFLSVGFPPGRLGMSLLQQQRIPFIFELHIIFEEISLFMLQNDECVVRNKELKHGK